MSSSTVRVTAPGMLTTVQDWPGRTGYWQVGVPPSGPMDDLSFRLGNRAVGNAEGAPGLEATLAGPTLHFTAEALVCVAGAPALVTVNGRPVPQWRAVTVPADGTLAVGAATDTGMRIYVLIAGGIAVPQFLGSAATFTLGGFGGPAGRALATGDVLTLGQSHDGEPQCIPGAAQPAIGHHWELAVTEGPHGAPDFFTRSDIDELLSTDYEVHFNSDRTGVRLIGPKPHWARTDGGEAGLHPSNIHDNAYSVGTLDFTGDTPILLGPDGPSLGGFVCPVTVVSADRWKLGQLRAGDTVRFIRIEASRSASLRSIGIDRRGHWPSVFSTRGDGDDGVLAYRPARDDAPEMTYRRSGDDNILVEYGDLTLDLALRARVHALHQRLEDTHTTGIIDLTPGIRSLQVHFDPDRLPMGKVLGLLDDIDEHLPASEELVVPSRRVAMPLSWDDPSAREAMERYRLGVRADAPWMPWNIEFIRRINGLDSVDEVHRTVYDASYLVLGLGDVYLGAPVATPVDPRHRLVTTKYNPARTWTPENAVGIGGAYLCIYGMEGPGGYQLVGRTVQVWNHQHPDNAGAFEPGTPWLLRFFDQINWYPVSGEELVELRDELATGRGNGGVTITDGEFSMAGYSEFLAHNAASIGQFRDHQRLAYAAEREAWSTAGEFARI